MSPANQLSNGESQTSAAAGLFGLIWRTISDILGTAAAATLIRRALKWAAARHPELADVVVTHHDASYRYVLPEAWRRPDDTASLAALRALARELGPLLRQLTGPVVVDVLSRQAALRARQVTFEPEDSAG